MIVTMKILQCAVKPVSVKRGWRYMRVCNLGHRKVSIVRIMRVNSRKNIWAFRRDKRNHLLYTGVCIKWVSAERGPIVVYSYFDKGFSEKSARDNPERCGGWFSVHWWFSKKFERTARETVDGLLRVLKKSNKSRFDSYSFKKQCIDYILYYLSGLSLALSPTTFLDMRILFAKYTPFKSHFPVFSIPIMMPIRQANLCSLQVLLNSRR